MVAAAVPARESPPKLLPQVTWWALAFPLVMCIALALRNLALLNWIHVLSGVLWTGADIFMGFIIGPVMRHLEPPQRSAVIAYLVPRTLLYFPAVSITTGTAGWYLASWLGMTHPASGQFPWIVVALVLVTIMSISGIVIMMPNALRIWFELRKPNPNRDLMIALNRINIICAGTQGIMQIAIIVVMSHLTLG